MNLVKIARDLSDEVGKLSFGPPVTHIYNPLEYAWEPHRAYLEGFGKAPKEVLFLSMNPGPFGMAQTGVPFGEVTIARDWLELGDLKVEKPAKEHPKRPILGFDTTRSEVSGARLWGWVKDRFETPHQFFKRFFVANYCPLAFLESSGRNRTPDKLPMAERKPLLEACDEALKQTVEVLQPNFAIGVGAFAEGRLKKALAGQNVTISPILHPSPASPAANRGWSEAVEGSLRELGVLG